VVVTHFAPHPRSIAPAYFGHRANPGFVLDLKNMMGPAALWIHGHTHTYFDYNVDGTRVVCNPRGIPGEAESIIALRDIALAELTRGAVHVAHMSARQTLDAVRWGKSRGVRVTCEVSFRSR
jgi:predicted phosphodiesterase